MKTIELKSIDKDWIDYSSLSAFMKCPRSFWWSFIMDIKSTDNNAAINGRAYHEACATYTKHTMQGTSHENAMQIAINAGLKIMKELPQQSSKYNNSVFDETMHAYFNQYRSDGNTPIEVEIQFAFKLKNIMFVGRIDEYCSTPRGTMIKETKTTSIVGTRWLERATMSLQIDTYYSAIHILTGDIPYGGMYDIIPIHEDRRKRQAPFRVIGMRDLSTVERWLSNIQTTLNFIEMCKDKNFFPQYMESCTPLMGYQCEYKTLCQLYHNPFNQITINLPDIYKHEVWYPYDELKKEDVKCL